MLTAQDIDIIKNVVIEVLEPRLLASEENVERRIDGKLVSMEERINGKLVAMEERFDGKLVAVEDRIGGKLVATEERIDGKLVSMERRIVTNLENKIDEKIDELAIITKHGFDEVHTRLDNIEHRLERVEGIVLPTEYSVATA